ncbi:STAS domain-containing protein [Kribbella sandramycini]|uniref:Anti-sigma factor antagonist n=1 Tax=Kribbella sandramycini TaxID=60450 RepID=A0A7Y4KZP0_9ACTN|nr:STAS domain-containing protein [Kribbella sandramycini]MBB6565363.1 anti-sigma B factor antagonist [Kribbella sandramycini]NOL41632.1 STAS domain-containing protein [Kribbella sandramycini]
MIDDDDLTIRTAEAADHLLLTVIGDLDLENAPAMTAALKDAIGVRPVILDLTGVDFMDSSGLGVLVGAHKEAAAHGAALLLAAPGPRLQKIFKITKLHKVFAVYESVPAAVAALGQPLQVEAAPPESVVPGFDAAGP